MPIKFEWDNPNQIYIQLENLLKQQGQQIQQVPERAIRRGIFELLKLVQDNVPKKTATLVRSLTAVVLRISNDLVEGTVATHIEYARYLEEGTGVYGPAKRPIVIIPKNKKALFWGAYGAGGKPIMARRIVQQGIKPLAPFATALATFLPRYAQIVQEELERAAA